MLFSTNISALLFKMHCFITIILEIRRFRCQSHRDFGYHTLKFKGSQI